MIGRQSVSGWTVSTRTRSCPMNKIAALERGAWGAMEPPATRYTSDGRPERNHPATLSHRCLLLLMIVASPTRDVDDEDQDRVPTRFVQKYTVRTRPEPPVLSHFVALDRASDRLRGPERQLSCRRSTGAEARPLTDLQAAAADAPGRRSNRLERAVNAPPAPAPYAAAEASFAETKAYLIFARGPADA